VDNQVAYALFIIAALILTERAVETMWKWNKSKKQTPIIPVTQEVVVATPENLTNLGEAGAADSILRSGRRHAVKATGSMAGAFLAGQVRELALAGRLDVFGTGVVNDLSEKSRLATLTALRRYPQVLPRIEVCTSGLVSPGLNGASIEEANLPTSRMLWRPVFKASMRAWEMLTKRTELEFLDEVSVLDHPYDPGTIDIPWATGGHAEPCLRNAAYAHRAFPDAKCHGYLMLPSTTQLRLQAIDLLHEIEKLDFVSHTVVVDEDAGRQLCMETLCGWSASIHCTDRDEEANNILRWLGHRKPGGFVVPRVYKEMIPILWRRSPVIQPVAWRERLVQAVRQGFAHIFSEDAKLADLPTRRDLTEMYVLVRAPVTADTLARLRAETEPMLAESGWLTPGMTVLWASSGIPSDTAQREAPFYVIAMEGVAGQDNDRGLTEVIKLAKREK